jgi:hypothetical protein
MSRLQLDLGVFLAPLGAVLAPAAHGLLALSEADPQALLFSPQSKLADFVSGVTVGGPQLSNDVKLGALQLDARECVPPLPSV